MKTSPVALLLTVEAKEAKAGAWSLKADRKGRDGSRALTLSRSRGSAPPAPGPSNGDASSYKPCRMASALTKPYLSSESCGPYGNAGVGRPRSSALRALRLETLETVDGWAAGAVHPARPEYICSPPAQGLPPPLTSLDGPRVREQRNLGRREERGSVARN